MPVTAPAGRGSSRLGDRLIWRRVQPLAFGVAHRCGLGGAQRLDLAVGVAAAEFGVGADGHLTYVKVGRRRLITHHHLQQFLADAPAQGASPVPFG